MDLVLLHTMLRWATTIRQPNGSRLLDANPLAGVRREREQNPTRPVASWEQFQRTRAAMQALQDEAAERHAADPESVIAEMEETRWAKMELALVPAEATGRRLGSIRQLRWEDIDFSRRTIRWRAEFDKKGKEWIVPMPESLAEELKQFRMRFGAITGWIFAGAEARRRAVAPVSPEVGDRAKASLAQGRRRSGWLEGYRDVAHLLSATGCRYVVGSDERAEEDARCGARIRLMQPPRPPDAGQVVGKTASQTAPPLIEAQSTAGAIANGASR